MHRTWAVAALAVSSMTAALLAAATPASAATTPPWEPDPNAVGGLSFYNAAGAVVTGGGNLGHLFDYAVASTDAARAGTTKATVYFGFPDHTKPDTTAWYTSSASTAATFPDASAPAPVNGFGRRPVAHAASSEANLAAVLGTTTLDDTAGYQHIVQIRVKDSGPGIGNGTLSKFWGADISFDKAANTWTQVFPSVATRTTTTLTSSPSSPQRTGTALSLTANVTPADVAGTVQFADGSTPLGTPVAVADATATYSGPAATKGTHALTATFTPTDTDAFGGSTSTASVVVADPPGAPSGSTATAGNAAATVSWTAPTGDGGTAITGYDLQYSSDGGTTWTSSPSGAAVTRTVTGLTNGTAYAFRVAARNGVGQGEYSAPSTAVTPTADASGLTIVAPASVRYNTAATVSTTLTNARTKAALAGASVSLYRRASSTAAYALVKTVTTSSKGAASTAVTLLANAQFQWRYAGTTADKAVNSTVKSVAVSQTVTAARAATSVRRGGTIKVYGTVGPVGTGQTVTLQRLVKATWTTQKGAATIRKQKLPNGKIATGFVFGVTLPTAGTYTYRVVKAATKTLAAGVSASLALRAT